MSATADQGGGACLHSFIHILRRWGEKHEQMSKTIGEAQHSHLGTQYLQSVLVFLKVIEVIESGSC